MKKQILLILCFILCLGTFTASAFSQNNLSDDPASYRNDIRPLRVSGKAIPWETFRKTKSKEIRKEDKLGFYFELKPLYPDEVKKLDGQVVELMGYMFPLQEKEKHTDFLFGPYPPSCPFHYHVDPAQVVEVITSKPIKFSFSPIRLRGRLKLTPNDENGVYYFLRQAEFAN